MESNITCFKKSHEITEGLCIPCLSQVFPCQNLAPELLNFKLSLKHSSFLTPDAKPSSKLGQLQLL